MHDLTENAAHRKYQEVCLQSIGNAGDPEAGDVTENSVLAAAEVEKNYNKGCQCCGNTEVVSPTAHKYEEKNANNNTDKADCCAHVFILLSFRFCFLR